MNFLCLQVAVCLTALLITTAKAQQPINYNNVDTTIQDVENQTVEEIEDKLKNFFHESRNKLYLAFYNLSSYLPLDINYAETVGKECDILEYNQDYYTTVGLVLGGLLGLIGIVFAFFGEFFTEEIRKIFVPYAVQTFLLASYKSIYCWCNWFGC